MKIKDLLLVVLLLVMTIVPSCKKEDPMPTDQSQSGSPVFSFSGQINGVPVDLQSGVGGYLITSSTQLDANGVPDFTAEFKQKNCSTCFNSLKVSIKGNKVSGLSSSIIDSSIFTGYYSYAMPSGAQNRFIQTFLAGLYSHQEKTFLWNFGDGTPVFTSTVSSVSHEYTRPDVYDVHVTVEDSTGCSSSVSNKFQVGSLGSILSTQIISSVGSTPQIITFVPVVSGGQAPYSYYWNFGDGTTSNEFSPTHNYALSGNFNLTLTVTDASGKTYSQNLNVPVGTSSGCSSYIYSTSSTPVANSLNLSGVTIEWKDKDGVIWTSANNNQTAQNSFFKIISIEEYLINESGQPTKKVVIEFSCKLYNGANSIDIKNAKTVVAIAY